MNLLDLILVALLLLALLRGIQVGALRQAGSLGGFLVGLNLGFVVVTILNVRALMPQFGSVAVFAAVMLTAFLGASLGEMVALFIERGVERIKLGFLNRLLGGLIGLGITSISIWLITALLAGLPGMSAALAESRVIAAVNQHFPPVPPSVIQVGKTLNENLFPRVFEQEEPSPTVAVDNPSDPEIAQAVAKARASTLKISGIGCGGVIFGSGFAVSNEVVATNAHVVAGISSFVVQSDSQTLKARPIYFNPDLDFALLYVPGLRAPVLPFAESEAVTGTKAVALGYPGGGGFTASPASVIDAIQAVGRNIYDEGSVRREVYRLQASVRHGNSGGPLVTPEGQVLGVIFAGSAESANVGYALTTQEVMPLVAQHASSQAGVSTQECIQ